MSSLSLVRSTIGIVVVVVVVVVVVGGGGGGGGGCGRDARGTMKFMCLAKSGRAVSTTVNSIARAGMRTVCALVFDDISAVAAAAAPVAIVLAAVLSVVAV